MVNEVKIIKLTCGDSIIAEVVIKRKYRGKLRRPTTIQIKDPLKIINEFDSNTGIHQTFLMRWIPQSKDREFAIPKKDIITQAIPILEVENYYYETADDIWLERVNENGAIERNLRKIQVKLMMDKPKRKEEIN